MNASFYVTGAGTEIGKTYVSCALLRAWRAQGAPCAAFKPVLSGFDPAALTASDAGQLLEAMGVGVCPQAIDDIAPLRFRAPLAPHLAAQAEGAELDFDAIVGVCRARMDAAGGVLLIEGAGGVMSPLTQTRTQLDLIAALKIPTLFVAGSYLGGVSHALSGLACLRHAGVEIAAIIVSESVDGVGLSATCDMIDVHVEEPIYSAPRNQDGFADLLALRFAP